MNLPTTGRKAPMKLKLQTLSRKRKQQQRAKAARMRSMKVLLLLRKRIPRKRKTARAVEEKAILQLNNPRLLLKKLFRRNTILHLLMVIKSCVYGPMVEKRVGPSKNIIFHGGSLLS